MLYQQYAYGQSNNPLIVYPYQLLEDFMGLHEILSKNIKELRKRNNLTQAELAEKCDKSNTFIGEIETGVKYPSLKKFVRIASVLNVEPYVLLIPKEAVINEIDRNELLHKVIEELREVVSKGFDVTLNKYLITEKNQNRE
jgi:transcriptional regulator with XRE-family HTH domain